MLMFFIFLSTNLFLILLVWACSRSRGDYRQGMLFGIHIPQDALTHPDVAALTASAQKSWNRFTVFHLIIGSAVCFPALWNFAVCILAWALWLVIYLVSLSYYTTDPLRKMYAIKSKNGWQQTQDKPLVRVDTAASAAANEKTPGAFWHLVIFCALLAPMAYDIFSSGPQNRLAPSFEYCLQYYLESTACILSLVFFLLQLFLTKVRNTVYSADSRINLAANQLEKSTWAKCLLLSDAITALSFLYLYARLRTAQSLYDADWGIFILLQLTEVLSVCSMLFSLSKQKRQLLDSDLSPIFTDDDVYWKNGYYCNPFDPRLLVQNRLCETNYTFNMARPAGKFINAAIYFIGALSLLFCIYSVIPLISIRLKVTQNGNEISISEGGYHCAFSIDEVKSASLLGQMPDGRFFKVNGASTDGYDIGRYKNRALGKCYLFLYGDNPPILEIQLKDQTIFLNSRTEGEMEKWHRVLSQNE